MKAQMITDKGTMVLDLYDKQTPKTVNNFTKLINQSLYLDQAYSTGTHTVTSINGMFYSALIEEIDRSVNSELKFKKVDSKNWSSSKTSKNIFSDMTSYGYNTI